MGVRVPPRRAPKKDTGILVAPSKTHPPSSSLIQESVPREAPQVEKSGAEETTLESIKITAPGTYELNLPSLFERDELIMAVKEGTYFIDLSSAFRKGKKD